MSDQVSDHETMFLKNQSGGLQQSPPELPAHLLANFATVAQHRSMTQAATDMGLPYSLVVKQVARLEGLVGHPLFENAAGKISLTENGQGLFQAVSKSSKSMQEMASQTVANAPPTRGTNKPTLTIEFSVWGIAAVLRPYLPNLRQLDCGFNFVATGAATTPPDVICYLGKGPRDGYKTKLLFGEEVVAVCAADYPLPASGLDAHGLDREPLLSLGHIDHQDDWSAFLGRDPNLPLPGIAKEPYASFGAYLKALKAGRGVGVGIASLFAPDIAAGKLQLASKRRLWRNRACYLGIREGGSKSKLADGFSQVISQIFEPQMSQSVN